MARLRYNGLTAALGGSGLTNVATSVTFAAALTHSNGTNVPTIVAPDYIPLAILGATGHLSEIVYLTAYTAGATTGTITRGQEGTAGAAHSSGDVVTQAMLTADYTGEGGGDYFRSGYYSTGLFISATTATVSMLLSRQYLRPFWVPARRAFDTIGINVTAAATAASGGVLRMGIYAHTAGLPGALIVDAGTISSESTGAKEIAITQTLDSGIYWLAVAAQVSTCSVTTTPTTSSVPFTTDTTTPPSSAPGSWLGKNSVTGAFSNPLGATTATGAGTAPFVCLRAL